MLFVVRTEEGCLEVAWMWLPFWITLNKDIKADLDKVATGFVGREITDELLEDAHHAIVQRLEESLGLTGLARFLDGIRHVTPR